MTIARNRTGRATSMMNGLLFGGFISLAITLLGSYILAKMVDMQKLLWENIGYGIMILLLIGSLAGTSVSYGKIKRRRMLVCVGAGAVYWGEMLAITALFFGGQYDSVMVTALLIMGGSIATALIGEFLNQGRDGRKRKRRYR